MIKSAVSMTLVLTLVASAVPLTAQQNGKSLEPDGPIATAITRESVRLALAPQGEPADVEWSRVRRLEPGREITVTIRSSQAAPRYFVSADAASVTVLNLTDSTMPAAVTRALREIASRHREYLEGAAKGGTFVWDNVRLAPTGVFVADRRVADLQHVVETSARTQVAEIKTRHKGRGIWGHLGPLGGYFVGAMAGGYLAGLACQAMAGRDRCDTGAFLSGGVVGGIAGGAHGSARPIARRRRSSTVRLSVDDACRLACTESNRPCDR